MPDLATVENSFKMSLVPFNVIRGTKKGINAKKIFLHWEERNRQVPSQDFHFDIIF